MQEELFNMLLRRIDAGKLAEARRQTTDFLTLLQKRGRFVDNNTAEGREGNTLLIAALLIEYGAFTVKGR